ncbi:hypothetical protein EsH8_V_000943 [Colletotrichum jinshuiense]
MEVGASLVAFIGFGLTSIKTFHKFISSVKDGPQKLQDLARALDGLRAAYERTQSLQDLPGILESSPSLIEQLKRCNDDVERFSKTLVKLQVQPNERLYSTLRKKFKLPLCEDEIRDMLAIFSGYVTSFTLEIGLIDIRIAHLNSSRISQVITGNEQQSNMIRQQHTSLQKINEDVFRSASRIEYVQNAVDALALKVESLPSVSIQQSASIFEMFAKLEEKVNGLALRDRSTLFPSRCGNTFDTAPAHRRNAGSENSKVVGSIQRLSVLVDEKDRVAESDEAQDIIEDLETLLQEMDTKPQHVEQGQLSSPGPNSFGGEKENRRELRQILGILSSSPKLSLNSQGRSQYSSGLSSGRIARRTQKLALYQSQLGNWLVSTRKQWRIYENPKCDEEQQEYIATIAFRPTAQGGLHHIQLSIRQLQQVNGFHAFAPALSIGRIRPSDSRVFQCVRMGLFDEFLRLIAMGEASLQDRDEKGAPLIHYAHSQPDISNFLIEHGADVDELANSDDVCRSDPSLAHLWGTEISTALRLPSLLTYRSPHCLQTFRTLLAAGADPTLLIRSEDTSNAFHFNLASNDDDLICFESVFELGAIFVDINEQDECGRTLLHMCTNNSGFQRMRTLIKLGADVNVKDSYGRTCLQCLVGRLRMIDKCVHIDREALVTLIEAGANILSQDNEGFSIWEQAAQNNERGSYARDIWDSVLVSCGYHAQVKDFAERVRRHAVYTDCYRRYHFELLWAGNEHLCPYYNDEASGLDSESLKSESSYSHSDSSSGLARLEEEDPAETESARKDKSESWQTESEDAGEHIESPHANAANGMNIEPESTTNLGSLISLNEGSHEALGSYTSRELLHGSVTSWLFASGDLEETLLGDALVNDHEGVEALPLSSKIVHTDEIFQNPWAED